jgi:hypothetical protein
LSDTNPAGRDEGLPRGTQAADRGSRRGPGHFRPGHDHLQLDDAAALSGILLAAGIAAYVVLAAVYAGRLAINRAGIRADAADPGRAFGFFTLAAGSDVLAARLAADDHLAAAAVLLVIGGVSWVGLGYLLPPLLADHGLGGASGSWFLWPVATQSVAVGLTSLPPPWPTAVVAVAVACWAMGVIGYLLVAGLVTAARLAFPVRPAALTPAYWVFMGASAISVLAGAQILRLPPSPGQLRRRRAVPAERPTAAGHGAAGRRRCRRLLQRRRPLRRVDGGRRRAGCHYPARVL